MFKAENKSSERSVNYQALLEMAPFYIDPHETLITVLANISALLNFYMDEINWVGFYLRDGDDLTLGPFQGLPACTRIKIGRGVCGESASRQETLIVDDVAAFPTHIVCDTNSKSEICVPLVKGGRVYGVLDVDSPFNTRFDDTDKAMLEKVAALIVDIL